MYISVEYTDPVKIAMNIVRAGKKDVVYWEQMAVLCKEKTCRLKKV